MKAAGKSASIAKQDDKWVLTSDGDRELDSEKVQTLIDSLRNLTAVAFPSESAADHGRYGLTAPAIEAEVQESEDGKQAEKVVVSDPAQERVYAAREGEGTVYEIEKAPAEEIGRALEEVLAPQADEPEEQP